MISVDSVTKYNGLANKVESISRLKSLRYRGLLVIRRSTILYRSRLGAALVLSFPTFLTLYPLTNSRRPTHMYIRISGAQPSRIDIVRSSTCWTRRSNTWGTQYPYNTKPTDRRCAGSRREWMG